MYGPAGCCKIGYPEGMAELSVFYCEEAIAFLRDCGMDDEGYYTNRRMR